MVQPLQFLFEEVALSLGMLIDLGDGLGGRFHGEGFFHLVLLFDHFVINVHFDIIGEYVVLRDLVLLVDLRRLRLRLGLGDGFLRDDLRALGRGLD